MYVCITMKYYIEYVIQKIFVYQNASKLPYVADSCP